jgi:hypothetical protein
MRGWRGLLRLDGRLAVVAPAGPARGDLPDWWPTRPARRGRDPLGGAGAGGPPAWSSPITLGSDHRRALEVLRAAGNDPVDLTELQQAGIAKYELQLAGYIIERPTPCRPVAGEPLAQRLRGVHEHVRLRHGVDLQL